MPLSRRELIISAAAGAAMVPFMPSAFAPSALARSRTSLPAGLWRSRSTADFLEVDDDLFRRYTRYDRLFALVSETALSDIERETLAVRPDGMDRMELEEWGRVTRTHYDRVQDWPDLPRLDSESGWSSDPGLTVNAFFEVVAGHFAFTQERGVDWAELRAECDAALARNPDSAGHLFDTLSAALQRLEDGHGSLSGMGRYTDSRPEPTRIRQAWRAVGRRSQEGHFSDSFSRDWLHHVRRHILAKSGRIAAQDYIAWGRLRSGIGYIAFMSCSGMSEEGGGRADVAATTKVLDRVLADLAGVKGIILDLRYNDGGWDRVALTLAARFTDSPVLAFTKQPVRSGVRLEPQPISVTPAAGPRHTGPVAVLISDATVSAAEIATLALRALPNTRLFGHPTYGALSDPFSYRLPNGWRGMISNEVYLAADGKLYENMGIPPDQPSIELSPDAFWETLDASLRDAESWLLTI